MGSINDILPKRFNRGKEFQTGNKTGGFGRNLKNATIQSSSFSGLRDNISAIETVVKKYEKYIRSGEVTKGMEEKMLREVKKIDPHMTDNDIRITKAMVGYFGKGGASKETAAVTKEPSDAAKRRAAAKAEFKPAPRRELPDFLQKRGDISANPLSRQPYTPGSGGGINNPQGGGSLAGNAQSSGKSFRSPKLY